MPMLWTSIYKCSGVNGMAGDIDVSKMGVIPKKY